MNLVIKLRNKNLSILSIEFTVWRIPWIRAENSYTLKLPRKHLKNKRAWIQKPLKSILTKDTMTN
jgi:hypothetical protein